MMLREGFYEDAIFRFIVVFPPSFPRDPPAITFWGSVLHPLIGADGTFDLRALFPEWSFEVGRQIIDVLTKLRSAFNDRRYLEVRDSLNPHAAELFLRDPESFLEQTLECAKRAKANFHSLPQDCPYRFDRIEPLSEKVKAILNDAVLPREEKKLRLREEIERQARSRTATPS